MANAFPRLRRQPFAPLRLGLCLGLWFAAGSSCAPPVAVSPAAVSPAALPPGAVPSPPARPVTLIDPYAPATVPAPNAPAAPPVVALGTAPPVRQTEATPDAPAAGAPGWLGVALAERDQDEPGASVTNVLRGSPAARSGLLVGDIVLGINGQVVLEPAQLSRSVGALGVGGRANLMVQRGADQRLFAVVLAQNPGYEGQLRLGFLDAPAPELEGVVVAQGNAAPSLQALRGRVVVLEFWATWCGACRALLPTLNDWHDRYASGQAQIVSVTVDAVGKAAQDAAQLGMRYSVLSDPEGQTAQLYQAFALPTLFVIDRAGIVRDVSVGYDPKRLRALEALLERLIAEPPSSQSPAGSPTG